MACLCLVAQLAAAEEDTRAAPVVTKLRFSGNAALSDDQLQGHMLTHEKGWRPWVDAPRLDAAVLEADVERLGEAYRAAGYYDARIRSVLVPSNDASEVEIEIVVEEGAPVLLRRFELLLGPHPDLPDAARASLAGALTLRVDEVFGSDRYREARAGLLRGLADRGFPGATIEGGAEVDPDSHAAIVEWRVEPGPFVRFGAIRVTGTEEVEARLVLRELTLREGDAFSRTALETNQAAVYDVGLFRSVALEPQPTTDPEVDERGAAVASWPIVVRVEERRPRSLSFAIGYGTEDRFRARGGWQHRNFFGGARRLDITGRYSSLLLSGDVELLQPHLFDTNFDLELYATVRRETPPAYQATRVGAGVTLRRRFGPHWRGRVGYRYEYNTRAELSSSVGLLLPTRSNLSLFELGARREQVDDPIDPRSGTWLDLSIEPSIRALGSDLDYVKLLGEARAYIPAWWFVLAGRVRAGTLEPLGSANAADVPIVKRFYSGGSTTVRGYDYQTLGPLDAVGDPLGGLTLIETSVELRFPIWGRLSGVAFFDAGQLSLEPFDVRGADFQYAAGGGLRFSTPLGPIRLDYGRALNPPAGFPSGRVNFSVGQTF